MRWNLTLHSSGNSLNCQRFGKWIRYYVVLAEAYNLFMPELCRFFGIIIRMFMEAGGAHHVPHFHAYYQEYTAIFSLDPVELIAGELPKRQRRLVEAWAELHSAELLDDWKRLQHGRAALPIDPLR